MLKSILVLCYLTTLFAQPRPAGEMHLYSGRTGLTLVSLANDGFALASDGAQLNADGTVSEVQKIFPVGKTGAVVLAGDISTQDPVTRPVREEFNASRITQLWLNAHPDANVEVARRELGALMLQAANRFFSKRNPGRRAGLFKFAVLFLDYSGGKASLTGARYFMPTAPGKQMRTEELSAAMKAGEVWIFGLVKVPEAVLAGNSLALKKYKTDPAITRFRSAHHDQLSAQDMVEAFAVTLHAAESPEGRKFELGRSVVGEPNRLTTITSSNGFSFSSR